MNASETNQLNSSTETPINSNGLHGNPHNAVCASNQTVTPAQHGVSSSRSGRVSVSLVIIGFQIPLFALLSFGNDFFLDSSSIPSLALLTGYCLMALVQLLFLVWKKPITHSEIMVYALLLVCTMVITSLTYHEQYLKGIDGKKNYILNIVGLSVSGIAVVFDMFTELRRRRQLLVAVHPSDNNSHEEVQLEEIV